MDPLLHQTRRHFFRDCAVGVGSIALASLLGNGKTQASDAANPLDPRPGHFPGKAKSVIYLFMAGGPSQLEMFDHKPELHRYNGQPIPESFIKGRRFAFMDTFTKNPPKLLGTIREFAQHGQSGQWVSGLLPYFSQVVDEVAIIRSVATDVFNHAPAKLFANTGTQQFGRPSMGSWVTYGIGSESQDLPGFVVLQSGPRRSAWRGGELGERIPADVVSRGAAPLGRRSDPRPLEPRGGLSFAPEADGRRHLRRLQPRALLSATHDPGDLRGSRPDDGVSDADECSGADRRLGRVSRDVEALWRGAGQAVVREQLFARPTAGRAWHPVRPALSHQLGPAMAVPARP